METIKVNMTPCEDIKTIHASQNDNEAREWGFELHNNGEKIDSSSISDQLVFKAYENGTEQILPENTSTPTTSPFLGNIKYPQGLLSDQEFLYRESPTEEDGLAKITDIKGNTLGWNQLVENGDFSTSSGWIGQFATVTISNNVASVRQDRAGDYVALRKSTLQGLTGHKYLVVADVKSAKKTAIAFYLSNAYSSAYDIQANTRTVVHSIITVSNANDGGFNVYTNRKVELAEGDVVEIYHVMCFDLTKMGLDSITDPAQFTSLFPLPYYDYNAGSLLFFNGNELKTVGFNQWDEEWEAGSLNASTGVPIDSPNQIRSKNYCPCLSGLEYYFLSSKTDGGNQNIYYFAVFFYDSSKNFVSRVYTNRQKFRVPENASYFKFSSNSSVVIYGNRYLDDICINISNDELNGTYEPYASFDLSLPILTYFPTGMKSAGSVYDELTETKAITRIGAVDLGTLNWNRMAISEGYAFVSNPIGDMVQVGNANTANVLCPSYTLYMSGTGYSMPNDKTYRVGGTYFGRQRVIIRDDSYTDATAFKTAMSGVYLYYELATYEETSFTTASLVTENAEIPLSNDDGTLIGKCTEELSENPGFIDAKIKLADADGECYSNKIQLHVERKPS